MLRRTLLLATLLVLALPAVASAQEYPPEEAESLTVSDSTLAPGESLTLEGEGFAPGSGATATLFSAPVQLGTFTADSAGTVRGSVTIPSGTEPGTHRLELAGVAPDGSSLVLASTITVAGDSSGAAAERSSGGLAFTGTSIAGMVAVGIALVAVGWGAVTVSRRRRVAQP